MKQTIKIIQKVGLTDVMSNFSLDENVTLRVAVATSVLLTRSKSSVFQSPAAEQNQIHH